jgi:thiamine biosynthesis lipoprotein
MAECYLLMGDPTKLATFAMATRFEIALEGDDPVRLRAAGEEALSEIEALDKQLSRFRPESDVSWINARAANEPVRVEPQLFRLLARAKEISEATGGAFDITVGPLMRAWGFTHDEGHIPDPDELTAARAVVGMRHVLLNEQDLTVSFDVPGVEIDLGAIGKGYAIERAVECLREAGVTRALVHGGTSTAYGIGDWDLGIAEPRASVARSNPKSEITNHKCHDSAVSVSAVRGRSFTENGREYGHVIDPRTGEPTAHTRLAAVWGPSPTDCDALSTALLVLGEGWLPEMVARFPGCDGVCE